MPDGCPLPRRPSNVARRSFHRSSRCRYSCMEPPPGTPQSAAKSASQRSLLRPRRAHSWQEHAVRARPTKSRCHKVRLITSWGRLAAPRGVLAFATMPAAAGSSRAAACSVNARSLACTSVSSCRFFWNVPRSATYLASMSTMSSARLLRGFSGGRAAGTSSASVPVSDSPFCAGSSASAMAGSALCTASEVVVVSSAELRVEPSMAAFKGPEASPPELHLSAATGSGHSSRLSSGRGSLQ
mmetsp:Transcript_33678/g.73698  ORF Transcript_33678/g.73698 Transcript_33678/m.73698 type:complete len:241 (+) Transcript_33678:380-1102(+)